MEKTYYTKPAIEVVRLNMGHIMTAYSDATQDAEEENNVIFGSKENDWSIGDGDEEEE